MKAFAVGMVAWIGILFFHSGSIEARENGHQVINIVFIFLASGCYWVGVWAYNDIKMKPIREGLLELREALREERHGKR